MHSSETALGFHSSSVRLTRPSFRLPQGVCDKPEASGALGRLDRSFYTQSVALPLLKWLLRPSSVVFKARSSDEGSRSCSGSLGNSGSDMKAVEAGWELQRCFLERHTQAEKGNQMNRSQEIFFKHTFPMNMYLFTLYLCMFYSGNIFMYIILKEKNIKASEEI